MDSVADFKTNNAALFSSRFSGLPSSIKLKGTHGGHHAPHHLDHSPAGNNNNSTSLISSGAVSSSNKQGPRVGSASMSGRLQGSFNPNIVIPEVKSESDLAALRLADDKRPSTASGVFATIRSTLQSSPKMSKAKKYLASSNGEADVVPTRQASRSFDAIVDTDIAPNTSSSSGNITGNNSEEPFHPRKSSWPSIQRSHSSGTATLIATSNSNTNSAENTATTTSSTLPSTDENNGAPVVGFMSLFNRAKAIQQQQSQQSTGSPSQSPQSLPSVASDPPPLSPKGIMDRHSEVDVNGGLHSGIRILSPRSSPLSALPSSANSAMGTLSCFQDSAHAVHEGEKILKPIVIHANSTVTGTHTAEETTEDSTEKAEEEPLAPPKDSEEPAANSTNPTGKSKKNKQLPAQRPPPPSNRGIRFAEPISTSESYTMHTLKTTTSNILKLAKGIDPFHHGNDAPALRSILKVKISPQYLALLQSNHAQQQQAGGGSGKKGAGGSNAMVNHLGNLVYPPSNGLITIGGIGVAGGVLASGSATGTGSDLFSLVSPISSTINTINTMNNTLANKHIPVIPPAATPAPTPTNFNSPSYPQQSPQQQAVPAGPTTNTLMVRDSLVVQKTLAEIHRRYGINTGVSTNPGGSSSTLPSVQQGPPAATQSLWTSSSTGSLPNTVVANSSERARSGTPIPAQVRKNMARNSAAPSPTANNGRPSTAPSSSGTSLEDLVNAAVLSIAVKAIQVNQAIIRASGGSSNNSNQVHFYATHLTFCFPVPSQQGDYNRTLIMQYRDIASVNLTANKLRLKGMLMHEQQVNGGSSSTVIMEFPVANGGSASNAGLTSIRERIVPMIMSQSFSR